jgi:hypothetical protein
MVVVLKVLVMVSDWLKDAERSAEKNKGTKITDDGFSIGHDKLLYFLQRRLFLENLGFKAGITKNLGGKAEVIF